MEDGVCCAEMSGAVKEETEPDHDPYISDSDDSHDDDFSDTGLSQFLHRHQVSSFSNR